MSQKLDKISVFSWWIVFWISESKKEFAIGSEMLMQPLSSMNTFKMNYIKGACADFKKSVNSCLKIRELDFESLLISYYSLNIWVLGHC